ncbi:MAG TPA: hypothetical protein VG708_15665 [Mycobacteriales bacterium]|nr:hypothetical protein [Mycobacteriales bacterium]
MTGVSRVMRGLLGLVVLGLGCFVAVVASGAAHDGVQALGVLLGGVAATGGALVAAEAVQST